MEEKMPGLTLLSFLLILGIIIYLYLSEPSPELIPIIFLFAFGSLGGILDYKKYRNNKLLLILGLSSLILMWIIVYPYVNQFNNLLISLLLSTIAIIGFMYAFLKSW
ncbi:hypothetical protein [Methanobacterium sp.]|uniref:hypothetical protein n=1 Tax=Methanobacterium sp. TaxID=2164 RepID=UPI0025F887D0|nr:hypothetical protein [Methanobacterium sp.]MBI5459208.1 hypothetical protein [Methanobacterium sp.]